MPSVSKMRTNCMLSLVAVATASTTIKLTVPKAPPAGSQVLDGAFQGYSMEMASFTDLAGNLSHPNKLSIQMLQNLKDITGSAAPIRVGGTTANHATYLPNQKEAYIPYYATPGADQPANLTLGPAYLESFHTFPRGTEYVINLSFDSGTAGEDKSVAFASAASKSLGDTLYAFEVGNEFDAFPVDRPANYTLRDYVPEWLVRTTAISKRIFTGAKQKEKIYQAGVFTAPYSRPGVNWTAQEAIDLGIISNGLAKTFCTHQYFGAACAPPLPTLAGSLMNRTALASFMRYHQAASAYSVAHGLPYVLGETNSIACQGLAGVSDVFGAALWSIDYALYAASLNVFKIYWQMGTGYRYAPWQGVRNGTTAPGPRPLYYGNWLVAEALGGVDKQVVPVLNTTTLGGYAVYGKANRARGAKLESLVIVNQEVFNSSTTAQSKRSSVRVELPSSLVKGKNSLSVQRLTASGAEVKEGITLAGRDVALDGRLQGRRSEEKVQNGCVTVKASEAVLVSFT